MLQWRLTYLHTRKQLYKINSLLKQHKLQDFGIFLIYFSHLDLHKLSVDNIEMFSNLLLARGSEGKDEEKSWHKELLTSWYVFLFYISARA